MTKLLDYLAYLVVLSVIATSLYFEPFLWYGVIFILFLISSIRIGLKIQEKVIK